MKAEELEHVYFFEGCDPAPSESHHSDDGAVVDAVATPRRLPAKDEPLPESEADWRFRFVYGRRFTSKEKLSARQWAGFMHWRHKLCRFSRICMDPNGGGTMIKRELISTRQLIGGIEQRVTPIGDFVDAPHLVAHADFILNLWKRGDPGVEDVWPELGGDDNLNDSLYNAAKSALEHGLWELTPAVEDVLGPPEGREQFRSWPEEKQWALKNLDALGKQLAGISVATREDGSFLMTKRNARQFLSAGKKDLVSAAMMCYAGFLMWLKSPDRAVVSVEDAVGFSGWTG